MEMLHIHIFILPGFICEFADINIELHTDDRHSNPQKIPKIDAMFCLVLHTRIIKDVQLFPLFPLFSVLKG